MVVTCELELCVLPMTIFVSVMRLIEARLLLDLLLWYFVMRSVAFEMVHGLCHGAWE